MRAHLLMDGERRLKQYLARGPFDPLTAATRAWMEAHTSPELDRLNELHGAARDKAWALERALVDACLRLWPETPGVGESARPGSEDA